MAVRLSSSWGIPRVNPDGNGVTLYDVTGRVLATKQDDYSPLHFEAPASGTYLIKIGAYPARRVVVIR